MLPEVISQVATFLERWPTAGVLAFEVEFNTLSLWVFDPNRLVPLFWDSFESFVFVPARAADFVKLLKQFLFIVFAIFFDIRKRWFLRGRDDYRLAGFCWDRRGHQAVLQGFERRGADHNFVVRTFLEMVPRRLCCLVILDFMSTLIFLRGSKHLGVSVRRKRILPPVPLVLLNRSSCQTW